MQSCCFLWGNVIFDPHNVSVCFIGAKSMIYSKYPEISAYRVSFNRFIFNVQRNVNTLLLEFVISVVLSWSCASFDILLQAEWKKTYLLFNTCWDNRFCFWYNLFRDFQIWRFLFLFSKGEMLSVLKSTFEFWI